MTKELPLYVCHKKVRALEIRSIGSYAPDASGKLRREVHFADPAFPSTWVSGDLFARYVPVGGDYYVVYEDGYTSFSPRKAFLDGYMLADEQDPILRRIDEAIAQNPSDPYPTGELQGLLRACYSEISRLRADVVVTRQMAGFKEVKREQKTDPDQPE